MKLYKENVLEIIQRKRFVLFVAMTALFAYGFTFFNITFSTDTLIANHHVGSGQIMLGAGRFGMTLLANLFHYTKSYIFNQSSLSLISVLCFIWAAVNFCVLFRRICGKAFSENAAIFFTCFFISYPLIIEIWQYTGANLCVCFGYLCDSFVLLMMHHAIHNKKAYGCIAGSVVLLMLVAASYESLVVSYIFGVFAILFLQVIFGTEQEKTVKGIILQGLCYAGVLVGGLILQVIVHKLILVIGNVEPASNGAREIYWLLRPIKDALMGMLAGSYEKMILKGIIYFPITELLISCFIMLVIGILCAKKRGAAILIPWAGMYLSLLLMNIVTGTMASYRTCQVFGLFVSFALTLVIMAVERIKYPKLKLCALFLCGWVCFHQALYVNYFFVLDHQRAEADINTIENIGQELYRNFDLEKPVIFVGEYYLNHPNEEIQEAASIPEDSIRWKLYRKLFLGSQFLSSERFCEERLSRKLPDTIVISAIAWGIYTPSKDAMPQLFSYHGYELNHADKTVYWDIANNYVYEHNVPSYPTPGYICDTGEFIVVHWG